MALRVVMMGTGAFAEPTFEALLAGPHPVVGLVTQPDRQVGQERGSTRQTGPGMKKIATQHNVPVFQPESVNTPEGVAGLRAFAPDLLVVAAYGQILSHEVLSVPPRGGVNVHASLLPKYRGAAPIAWAIYHGEARTGVTIIRMSTSLDAGDMLAQQSLEILPDETAGELEARLAPLGASLAMTVLAPLEAGAALGLKQDRSQATKAPKLKKDDGRIDWGRTAVQVCLHVRAMQPWPTPFTFLHRAAGAPVRLIIPRAHATTEPTALGAGGLVPMADANGRLLVAAGDGRLVEVVEVQPAGKRRMAAAEFLRGHPPRPGDRLGPESP